VSSKFRGCGEEPHSRCSVAERITRGQLRVQAPLLLLSMSLTLERLSHVSPRGCFVGIQLPHPDNDPTP
jgi:hypothetical protein